jgi:hypothetical protein
MIIKVISIECFEKIRHAQKIFPLKSVKGFKCIYNELERKGSLPYIEQKRAASSSPNTRKIPPPSQIRSNNINSPTNSPKLIQKSNDQQQQKSVISYNLRQTEDYQRQIRLRDTLSTPLRTNNNNSSSSDTDPLVMKYQSIQRYKTNFEILKPSTIIAEEWDNLDRTQKNRLSNGGSKTLVLISKSSTENKSIQPLQT